MTSSSTYLLCIMSYVSVSPFFLADIIQSYSLENSTIESLIMSDMPGIIPPPTELNLLLCGFQYNISLRQILSVFAFPACPEPPYLESRLPRADAMLSIPSRIRYTATTYPMNRMVMKVSRGLKNIKKPSTSPAMFTASEK